MATAITHVLFDLDGTLADTAPDLASALNRQLDRYGRPHLGLDKIRPIVSLGSTALVERAFGIDRSEPRFAHLRQEFIDLYADVLDQKTRLFPEVEELLATLDRLGLPWGIVTNKLARLTGPVVAALGLSKRSGCVVSGDTAERAKPHPDPLLLACRLLDCTPAQAVYVGDARADIDAARRAGMAAVAASYGYTPAGEDPQRWGADAVVARPLELLDWLRAASGP